MTIATVAGTFQVSVNTSAGCQWTASTSDVWMHFSGAASGQGTGVVAVAADGTSTARQGTVTVSWAGGSQSIAVTQTCDITQTMNLPAEGQQFIVSAPAGACNLNVSSASVDVPWISIMPAPYDTRPPTSPILPSVVVSVGVNTGPERVGHLTTPIGQVTIVQIAGNCVTAIAPTSQALDENGGAGSFSVTAVPGCAWDATTHSLPPPNQPSLPQVAPLTAHGIGSGVVQFTVAANTDTFALASEYIVGGTLTFQITQSKCPVTVSPLSFHVPAAAADYVVAVRTGAVSCRWFAGPTPNSFIVVGSQGILRGSVDVRLSVTQNQTGLVRTSSATVGDQTVVVTQDP